MNTDLTVAEVRARIRWVRICMLMLALQDDMAEARVRKADQCRKALRW